MIRKIVVILLVCSISISIGINKVSGEKTDITPNATASILIEESSKQILYSKNEVEKLFPASTTKIMTMILLFEAINSNRLKWDDIITTSEFAASMGGSQVYLEPNEKMSVKDMFKSIAIASANDASVAVGETIGGSNEKFVEMMNQKAKDLGLVNTHFKNATGLHDDGHYTCALDLALMAAHLIKIGGEELFKVTSLYDSYIRENSPQSFWLVNTNKLLKLYEGVDGLKTGFTKEAGYCLVTTVKRDNLRLIGVILKETEPKVRNEEMIKLLNYGYNTYKQIVLYKKEDVIDEMKVDNSEKKSIKVISDQDVIYIQNKNNEKKLVTELIYSKTVPPIKQGEKIGVINIYLDDVNVTSYNLYSQEDVGLLNYFERAILIFKKLF